MRRLLREQQHRPQHSSQLPPPPVPPPPAAAVNPSLGSRRRAVRCRALEPARPAPAAAAAAGSAATATTTTSSRPVVPGPPPDYNYKADILPVTREVVSVHAPQLLDLVDAGNLVAWARPPAYQERRADGYQEPQLIFLLGTAHVSQASAREVSRVVAAVQPDAVVVELCRSRSGALQQPPPPVAGGGGGAGEQQQDQQPGLDERQQRWKQQYEAQRQRHGGDHGTSSSSQGAQQPQLLRSASGSSEEDDEQQDRQPSQGSSSSSSWWRRPPSAAASSKASNPMALGGTSLLAALARSAQLGGQQAMLLRLLLASQARRAAEQLGAPLGGEFRAAAEAAAEVPNCQLVLGDRPIEITLQRAWDALPWRRRALLLWDLLGGVAALSSSSSGSNGDGSSGGGGLTQQQVEALRSDDAVSALFAAMAARYPELVGPLLTERDLYLAWSLKRSKAVNGAAAVVGVVGKGHLRGVVWALRHDPGGAGLRFSDLVGGKNSRRARAAAAAGAAQRFLLELVLGGVAYGAWVALQQHGQ